MKRECCESYVVATFVQRVILIYHGLTVYVTDFVFALHISGSQILLFRYLINYKSEDL